MFETRAYPDEIADKLIAMGTAEDGDKNDLVEALYQLHAICGNDRNSEYYRTLYKALENLSATVFEIRCTYYNKATGDRKELWHRGASINDAFETYVADGEAHDLAKYTPRTITSIGSFSTI